MRLQKPTLYVALCLPFATAYFVLPTTSVSKLVLYNGLGLSAVVAMIVGIRRNRPPHAGAWYLFAAGLTSFLTADVLYYVNQDILGIEAFPSLADPFYLAMYPLVASGLVILIRAHSPGRDVAGLIDAAIAAVSVFALLWVLVMDAYVVDDSMTVLARITSLAYPVMDIALIAVLAHFALIIRVRGASLLLMVGAIGFLLIADLGYMLTTLAGTFETGSFIDAFWILFYILFASSALHPSMGAAVESSAQGPGRLTSSRLVVLAILTVNVPLANLLWGESTLVDRLVATAGSISLFLLVLGRVWLLLDTIKAGHARATWNSLHDGLTGLANRSMLSHHLEEVLEASPEGAFVGVLFVDLDDFKTVNDRLGHQAGDVLLREVARRLTDCVGIEGVNDGVVARLGGDEFAILIGRLTAEEQAVALADTVIDALNRPVAIEGDEVLCSASVGVAVAHLHGGDYETLLRNADIAMYAAKSKGKRRFECFEQVMYDQAVERLELRADLHHALDRGELEVHYQPIFEMGGRRVVSVEALLRWHHPHRGLIPPSTFIPLAEETGQIVDLGNWVLQQACNQVSAWQRERPDCAELGVSVNLSVHQLHDPDLLFKVSEALRIARLDAGHLTLELTESVLMHDVEFGASVLDELKSIGVKIAIDDFGTGYSSFGYLHRFAVDVIKIDRSFVAGLQGSSRAVALAGSLVELARALSLDAVAEGIEQAEQLTVLADMGCKYGQGFFMAVPREPRALEQYFEELRISDGVSGAVAVWEQAYSTSGTDGVEPIRDSPTEMWGRDVWRVEVLHGAGALERLGADLEDLHTFARVPIMARSPWLSAWAEAHNSWEPLTIVVRDQGSLRIVAAALLAQRFRRDGLEVVGLGHGSSCTRLAGRDDDANTALAKAIGDVLEAIPSRWRLDLGQLPLGDPVALALQARLGHAHIVEDLRVPRVTLSSRTTSDDYLSRNMRKQIRRAHAQLQERGVEVEVHFESDIDKIAAMLPRLADAHLERDHLTRRSSDLDDPAAKTFWYRVLCAHNEIGKVEIATLRLNGELAAYVVGLLDEESWRVFDGHMVSRFSEYSPGRLIEAAVVDRVVTDKRFSEIDWMSGVAAEKLLCSTDSEERMRLVAISETGAGCAWCRDTQSSETPTSLVTRGSG